MMPYLLILLALQE